MKTLFLDVDTQLDFLFPAGALYVPGAEQIVPLVAQLNRYAAAHNIPIVSTADAHAENDVEFREWPKHCVAGTLGQHKAAATLIAGAEQYIVEKQTVDVFQCAALQPLIERLAPERVVVYGVVTEICVLYAVRGLVKLGKHVTVVSDAIQSLTPAGRESALSEMQKMGAEVVGHALACPSPVT